MRIFRMPLELLLSPSLTFPSLISTSTYYHHPRNNQKKMIGIRSIFLDIRKQNKYFQFYTINIINSRFFIDRTNCQFQRLTNTCSQQQNEIICQTNQINSTSTKDGMDGNDDGKDGKDEKNEKDTKDKLNEEEIQNMKLLTKYLINSISMTKAFEILQKNQHVIHQLIRYSTLYSSQLEETFQLYNKLKEHSIEISFKDKKHLILKFLENLWPKQAVIILKDIIYNGNTKPDIILINKTLACLKKTKNYKEAPLLFISLLNNGIQLDTCSFTIIIQIYSLQGQMSTAVNYYEKMLKLGIRPNEITYLILIQGFSKQNDLKNAYRFYNLMLKTNKRPTYKILNTLADLYVRNEELGKAEETFKTMKNLNIKPDLSLYNIIIYNSTVKLDMKTANGFYQEIINSGFKPDIYTRTIMLNGYIKVGDHENAWKMYNYIMDNGVKMNEHVGNSLIHLHHEPNIISLTIRWKSRLSNANDIHSANMIYNEFLDTIDKGKNHFRPDSRAFNIFISKFAQYFGDMERAQEIHNDMLKRGISSDVYTFSILIDGYALLGQPEKAMEIFELLKSSPTVKPNAYSYTCLLKAWGQVRRRDKVKEIYEEMLRERIKPHGATYSILLKDTSGLPSTNYSKKPLSSNPSNIYNPPNPSDPSNPSNNEKNLPFSKPPQHVLDTLIWLGRLQKAQNITYAYKVYKNFINYIDNSTFDEQSKPNNYSFTIFIQSFALYYGEMSLSLKVLDEMIKRNIQINNVTFGILIEGYARLKQPENAERMFFKMLNMNIKPGIKNFNSLIGAWVKVE
ncbi:2251_t:CDS:2 [Diversispora eburnea]|uniref:2251_t:CDS:1 n=1 Tax=Diversispora eburnea TaxID=1213867 RepID=A0A9N9FLT0_9GLOM|nr:2251_t:CDS:2 [Diversispora eburnea]